MKAKAFMETSCLTAQNALRFAFAKRGPAALFAEPVLNLPKEGPQSQAYTRPLMRHNQ